MELGGPLRVHGCLLLVQRHDLVPDLIETVQERTAHRPRAALADRLARLSLAGRLRPCDPEQAAEHFFALLTGPLEFRSRLGTRRVPAAELRGMADAAVDAFLRAYGSDQAVSR